MRRPEYLYLHEMRDAVVRIIDIVGLDKQADGGTHVISTAEVGAVRVAGTESKGKDNKRIRLEVLDPQPEGGTDA